MEAVGLLLLEWWGRGGIGLEWLVVGVVVGVVVMAW